MQFDRLELLMKQQGKTKKHMGEIVGKGGYYIKDCKTKGIQVPETIVRAWADDLNTSYEYLMGMDHLLFENDKEKLRYNMAHPNEAHEVFVQRVQNIEEVNRKEKFNELYQQIAQKETAEADLQELQRFMEYLVKRGE